VYGERTPALPRKRYGSIVIDPPWSFGDRGTRLAPSYEGNQRIYRHYDVMELDDVCTLKVEKVMRDDCWVWLWIPEALRRDGVEHIVTRAWGIALTGAALVWVKTTNDGSRPRIGGGHYLRNAHEVCLLCKRGKPKRLSRSIPSVITAPRGRHSEKPQEFYDMVLRYSEAPHLDMFSRRPRAGYDGWGDQYDQTP